jgi:cell wall-associated NlpC family hydrolase
VTGTTNNYQPRAPQSRRSAAHPATYRPYATSRNAQENPRKYQWGATGPGAYDCSGLVYAAYAAAGIHIARTTYQWRQDGPQVPLPQIQPGDLLFSAGSDGPPTPATS